MSETGSDILERFERMVSEHICPMCGQKMNDISVIPEVLILECPDCGESWNKDPFAEESL